MLQKTGKLITEINEQDFSFTVLLQTRVESLCNRILTRSPESILKGVGVWRWRKDNVSPYLFTINVTPYIFIPFPEKKFSSFFSNTTTTGTHPLSSILILCSPPQPKAILVSVNKVPLSSAPSCRPTSLTDDYKTATNSTEIRSTRISVLWKCR